MSRLISERQQMLQIEKEESERRDREEDANTSSSSSSDSSSSDSDTEEERTPPSPTRRRTHMLAQERPISIRHGNSRNTTNSSNRNRGDGTVVVPSRIPNRTQPVPIWTPPDFDCWSAEKQRLWRNLAKAPAAFYYKYCPPGVARIETPWSASERTRFLNLVETRPCGKEWGYLAMHMPGRTGQMCELFYKQLQEEKKTGVKAGQVLPPLPLEAAPLPTKTIPIVAPAMLSTPPTSTIVKAVVVTKPATPTATIKAATLAAPVKTPTSAAPTLPTPSVAGVRAPASLPVALAAATATPASTTTPTAASKVALSMPAAPRVTATATAATSLAATVAAVSTKAAVTKNMTTAPVPATAPTVAAAAAAAAEDDGETTSSSSSSSSSDSDTETDSDDDETEDEQVTLTIPAALAKTPSAPSTAVTRPLQARATVPLPVFPSSLPKGVLAPAALLADGRLRATASATTAVHKVELSPSAISLLPVDANTLAHAKAFSVTDATNTTNTDTPASAAPLPSAPTPVAVPVAVPVASVALPQERTETPSTPTAVTPAVTPVAPGAPAIVRTRARTDTMPRRDAVVRNLTFDGISVDNLSQDDDNNDELVSTRIAGTSLSSPTASAFLISAAANCSIVSQSSLRGEYAPVPANGHNPINTRLKARSTGPPTRTRATIAKKTRPAATVTIDVTVPVTLSFSLSTATDTVEEARVPVAVTTRVTVPTHTAHAQASLLNDQHAIALSRFAAQMREKKRKAAALAAEYDKNMEEYEEVKRHKREVTATENTIRATRANPDAHAKARALVQTQSGHNPTIFGHNNVPDFEMEDSVNHRNPISLNDYCYKLYSQFDAHKYSADPVMSNTDQANYVYNTRTKFVSTTRAPAMPAPRPMFAPRQQVNLWENLAGAGITTSQCPIPVTTKSEPAYTSNLDVSTIVADAGHYAVAYQAISSLHDRGYLSGVAVNVNTQ